MKYEITPEDRRLMEYDLDNDRTLKYLRNLTHYKFSVGDVLVRENLIYSDGEKKWKLELGSGNIPHKYVYLFENDLKVGYIRRLSINGRKFVEQARCVTEFDPDNTRFKLDPEYADHMLLAGEDDEFDASSRYDIMKRRREAINRRNKKIAVPMADEAAARAWIKTLKVGDQIWYGYSIGSIYKTPYTVDQINLYPNSTPRNPHNLYSGWNQPQDHIIIKQSGSNYGSNLYVSSLPRYYVFMQRPEFLDEVIG